MTLVRTMAELGDGLALSTLVRFARLAVDALGRAREEIDALNVCTGCLKAGKVTR